jgi:hypothetical protein
MIGQGRPALSLFARAREAVPTIRNAHASFRKTVAAMLLAALWLHFSSAERTLAQDSPLAPPVRVRISWGGARPVQWQGRLWLDSGAVSDLKLLGLAPDRAGSIWLDDGQIRVRLLTAHATDTIEVSVDAAETAQLFVDLKSNPTDPRSAPSLLKVPLGEVLRRPFEQRIDDHGNTLRVEILPDDGLGLTMDRTTLIFAPGEQLSLTLHPQLPDLQPGTSLDIRTSLFAARRNDAVWNDSQRMDVPVEGAPEVKIDVPLPMGEGVYSVRVAALRPPGFRPRFFPGGPAPMAERTFDVVVLDPTSPRGVENGTWETVLEFDPTIPSWWDRLPAWTQLRRIPAFNFKQLGSIRAGTVDLPTGRFVELPPTTPGSEPHWQAYLLPIETTGEPHVLEVEYPANGDQHFSVSIVEPNEAGVVEKIGRDSGVYVEGFGERGMKQTHRMLFWPRTMPMLLIANQHPKAAAQFGHIRVRKLRAAQPTAVLQGKQPSGRLVAAYAARPLVSESFGHASGVIKAGFDPHSSSFDDWQSFYEGTTRFSDSLRLSSYNSAVVSVLADGSAIYPSEHIPPLPRYNSGRSAANATERDALELMLRVFDRDGLALIPAVQLASPIPALEKLRRAENPQTSGLEWVGPNGKTWIEVNGTHQGLAPYYNLLDTRVQQAVLQIVQELVDRYREHPALTGVAIQLSANGYAQLPPLDWGLDDATIAQFQRDTGIELAAPGPNRFAARHALLTQSHAEAWRKWRAERVAAFYAKAATIVHQSSSIGNRRLILTLEDSFSHPNVAARVRPNILQVNRVDAALLDAGIDRPQLEHVPGLCISATRYVGPMTPLAERAVDCELNEAFSAWHPRNSDVGVRTALLYHRPVRQPLSSFQAAAAFLQFASPFGIVSQPAAHGNAARQAYARALLLHDPAILIDGGEFPLSNQDDSLRNVREIIRSLPTTAEVTDVVKQPVTVRAYAEPDGVTLVVVNESAWSAAADITLEVPQAAAMTPVNAAETGAEFKQSLPAGRQTWKLKLEPYAIHAVRINSPGIRVAKLGVTTSDAAETQLRARIADLEKRDLNAPRAYAALSNPDFEPVSGAGLVSGWSTAGHSAVLQLDADQPQSGTTCVYFRNDAGAAVLESEPLATPPTGQLAVIAFVRGLKMSPGAELRMVLESRNDGQLYRRSAVIAVNAAAGTGQWQSKAILVNDLPLEQRGNLQLRFEMTGPGEVWIDNVAMYDLLFPLKFYKFEEAEILQFIQLRHAAQSALDAGQIVDAARVMDKYWPRFLFEYTPAIQPAIAAPAAEQQPRLAAPPNEGEQPVPGISERIKRVFPFVK